MKMKIYQLFLFILLFFIQAAVAQIPKPDAILHYTQVYFETDFVNGAESYQLFLYSDSAQTNEIAKVSSRYPAFQTSSLQWMQIYYWTVRAFDKDKLEMSQSPLYKFEIGKKINALYVSDSRLDVRTNKVDKHNGGLILMDYARGIFDRQGSQLWSVPQIEGIINERKQPRDLKVTVDKTITFLGGSTPVEIDFEGNVLWKAPTPFIFRGDTITFHHDFRKMKNGHYYVLGNRKVDRKVIGQFSDEAIASEYNTFRRGDSIVKRTLQSVLLEFDGKGNLVWFWDSNDYISDEDLNYKKNENGLPGFGTHANAFSVNEENTKAYVGFRDLNRIVRIDKKTKKVEFSFGEKYPSGDAQVGHDLFRGQHDATVTKRKSILVFNNNNDPRGKNGVGSILEINDAKTQKENLILWKFDFNFDTLSDGISHSTGNLVELENGNFLVCGGMMPRIFEVTKTKEIVWDAFVFNKSETEVNWTPFQQYRCHFTPQLYFYHFLARVSQNEARKDGKNIFHVEIINTGNSEDQYLVELFSQKKLVGSCRTTKVVSPGDKILVSINSKNTVPSECEVKITSKENKTQFKVIKFNLQ